jgi:hypothetical protein
MHFAASLRNVSGDFRLSLIEEATRAYPVKLVPLGLLDSMETTA